MPTNITIKQAIKPGTPASTRTPKRAAQTPAVAAAERSISPKIQNPFVFLFK